MELFLAELTAWDSKIKKLIDDQQPIVAMFCEPHSTMLARRIR
jgi:hypothetical protein